MTSQKNIVILISGGGSNMAAIVRAAQREHWLRRFGGRIAGSQPACVRDGAVHQGFKGGAAVGKTRQGLCDRRGRCELCG